MSTLYRLTIDEKQAHALIAALDLYSRLHSGQYTELGDIAPRKPTDWDAWHRENDALIAALKSLHFDLPLNASHGIFSERVPLLARMAYDIQQVVRKQVATDEGAESWNVWLRDFMSTSGHPFVARIEKLPELRPAGDR